MAFGKKYFSSYKSNNNLDYYLEIFLEDYTGSALELVMGAGGPVIEYETDQEDRFSPIISSSCKIPYLVENFLDSTFIDDLRNNYQERQVYVHIYRSTQSGSSGVAPLWSGFLVMDIGSGVDKYFPYEEHLKFVDGLSLLKDIDFVDLGVSGGSPPFEERVQGNYAKENMYFGPGTYIYWIREILAKSGAALTNQGASQNYGFTTSVNWYNGEMNATGQSSDPLHKTKCSVSMFHRKDDQGVFYPDNCYNVLKELLRHWGARITYWKHEFWIVQIPEYITSESGTISTPVNNNSRLYSNTGAYQGSQNHLGSTYYTRYEQTIENDKISKLSGTKYNYLPLIKQVNADFLSFSSKSYFGGFPFGSTAPTQEVFQGTINSPSAADFLYLSIPLDWTWDMSQAGNVNNNLSAGHTMGWWCAVKFNFYASDGTTTYYLQYNFSDGSYYWVDSALWTPLGGKSPRYTISSKLAVVSGWVGFEKKIPFQDENGSAISMTGAWSFFLDIEDYGTSSSNPGSFYCNFSGYTGYGNPTKMRNPQTNTTIVSPLGVPLKSGTVSWSNTLVDQQGQVTISTINNPAGFNAGTVNPDIRFATTSPFTGLLQTLNNAQSASNGETFNVINSNLQAKQNSEQFDFGTLLWGDSLEFAPSSLQVFNGSTYVNTEPSGEWGRGILTGTKTFTKMLIDEFFSGQTKIIISPSMRLAVGVANKNEDQSGTLRPRYVNPIGKLRETRDGTDPEYFFRRGSFYTLLDEWDYEGYEIIRNVPTTTTQSNGMGSMGGSQSGSPAPSGMSPNLMVQALSQNSPLAYIRATIPATGSNVAVNGNFNTAVGWSLGSGWSIDTTAKKAKFAATGSTSELTQSVLTQGLTYQVNFQVEVTAGTLLVKAGTSGTSQSITSSGDYSIYLDCEGSSLIKFQAGTTFTGNITYITLRDQKSLSSVPIESIGTAVFKTGDTFNLINSNDDTILPLTVTSNQGSGDTTISVSSTPLYEDIDNGSYLLINQDDLSEQYQNKTKGTVAGFGIDADGISKGGIEITGWLNSDTMSGAAVTNVPTALSVKNYVDGQVGASDTLAEVLANGNTSGAYDIIMNNNQEYKGTHTNGATYGLLTLTSGNQIKLGGYEYTTASVIIGGGDNARFNIGLTEKMRLTATGLGIGTTSPGTKLHVGTGSGATVDAGYQIVADSPGIAGIQILAANNQSSRVIFGDADDNDVGMIKYDHTDNSMGFRTNGSGNERMRITDGGRMGINTSTPQTFLDVNLGGATNQYASFGGTISSGEYTGIHFGYLETGNSLYRKSMIVFERDDSAFGDARGKIHILNGPTGSSSSATIADAKLTINQDGNVGINQQNPTEKLHVVGDALITGDSHADAFKPAATGNPIKFKNFGSTELARITDGGFLGLNETSPNYIIDANITSSRIRFKAVTGNANLELSCIAGRDWLVSSITDGSFRIYDEDAAVSRLLINSSGNLRLPAYGSGSFTGTATKTLGVTSSGEVIELTGGGAGGPYLPLTGGTLTGDLILGSTSSPVDLYLFGDTTGVSLTWSNSDDELQFSDNAKAVFGDSGDLQIYHDGNNSYIKDVGTGNLRLRGTDLRLESTSLAHNYIICTESAGVALFYNDVQKLTTSNTGISITGGGIFTGSDVGATDNLIIKNSSGTKTFSVSNNGQVNIDGSQKLVTSDASIELRNNQTGLMSLKSASNYGISFGDNGGESMRINTSTNNVLIGTTTDGGEKLQVNSGSWPPSSPIIKLYNGVYTYSVGFYGRESISNSFQIYANSNVANINWNSGILKIGTQLNYNIEFYTGDTTKMTLTSGGNLGVGESNPILGKLQVAGNIFVNRNGTNGLAANPYFENLLVSGIGTTNVSAIQLGNSFGQDTGTYLRFQVNSNSASSTPVNSLILNPNGTATFSGQVTIPATPVASTDAASKGYVDAQVGASDTLQEVTDNGNTTTNSVMIGSSSSPATILEVAGRIRASSTDSTFEAYESSTKRGGLQWDHTNDYLNLFSVGGDIRFDLGGEKMRLTSGGNLGINCTPSYKLQWSDGTRIGLLDTNIGAVVIGSVSNDALGFYTNLTERMRLTSGGNLLLGTTTDTGDKLNVSGNVTTANLTSTTGNIYGSTNLFVNALNGYVNFRSNNDNIYYDGGYHIFRDSDASPEYMRLTSSGNLLLGTTTDSAKLVVKIGSANDVIQRWETTNGLAGILQTSSDFSEFNLYQPAGNAFVSLKTNGNSYFNGGNLGIGTTSPVSQIESKDGSIRTTTLNSFSNLITGRASIPSSNGFNLGGLLFQAYSTGTTYTTGAAIYSYADSSAWTSTNAPSYLSFHTTSSGSVSTSEKMQIKANGNLLLGTTVDSGAKLNVSGGANFNGSLTITDYINHAGDSGTKFGFSANDTFVVRTGGAVRLTITDNSTTLAGALTGTTATFSGTSDGFLSLNSTDNGSVFMDFKRSGSRSAYFGYGTNSNDFSIATETTSGNTLFITNSSERMRITSSGSILIGTTTDSLVYRLDVFGKARVQSVFELDDVLTLNQISTPSDPASGKSSIYMDSADGAIKVKINVGGTVVTRTIASFEG